MKIYKHVITGQVRSMPEHTVNKMFRLEHEGKTYPNQGWVPAPKEAISAEAKEIEKEIKQETKPATKKTAAQKLAGK